MQSLLNHDALRVVPAAQPGDAWTAPEELRSAADLRAVLDSGVSAGRLTPERLSVELLYNRARPTRIAWWVLTLSLLLSGAAMLLDRRALDLAAGALLVAGFAVMSWGIWLRWQVAGRIPASNMYESLLFLGWGVGAFAVIATVLMRNRIVVLNAAAGAALTMALTDLLPIDRFVHPMPPVLSGTYWLAIHVPIIMVGYAVLALGMVVAHMQIGVEAFAPAGQSRSGWRAQYYYITSAIRRGGHLTARCGGFWGRYRAGTPGGLVARAFLTYGDPLRGERLIGDFSVAAWASRPSDDLMTYLGVTSCSPRDCTHAASATRAWCSVIATASWSRLRGAGLDESGGRGFCRPGIELSWNSVWRPSGRASNLAGAFGGSSSLRRQFMGRKRQFMSSR
jgi:hypothetical protein